VYYYLIDSSIFLQFFLFVFVFRFLWFLSDGNYGFYFIRYFVDFSLHDINVSIDLSLVVLINLRYGEQSDVSDYEKGETVKPCPDVRQAPEENGEFDGVD